jgi:hypothetical protein
MSKMRAIEIDFEVHQQIELERTSFDESPNEVLRRLLKLPPASGGPALDAHPSVQEADGRPWSGKGVTLPHGTEIRMDYNGKVYSGGIADGQWVVEGKHSKSPSDAAGSVAKTRNGKVPSLNGWIYWQVKRPGDASWSPLNSLRRTP